MNSPEPEDLDRISRAFFRMSMKQKLPGIRERLAEIAARKNSNNAHGREGQQ